MSLYIPEDSAGEKPAGMKLDSVWEPGEKHGLLRKETHVEKMVGEGAEG